MTPKQGRKYHTLAPSVSALVVSMKVFSKDEVISLLKKQQGKRQQKQFAADLGISPAYLSDVYQGRRDPGPAILDHLNLTWAYVRKA